MSGLLVIAVGLSLLFAFAAIALGRNLTRSIAACFLFVTALAFALLLGGGGFVGLVVVIVAVLLLGLLQIFGWMLVDVDRDHLPPTERPTSLARGIAFLLLAGGLVLFLASAFNAGELTQVVDQNLRAVSPDPARLGELLFGPSRDVVLVLGFAIASSLLATLLLLQDDEGEN